MGGVLLVNFGPGSGVIFGVFLKTSLFSSMIDERMLVPPPSTTGYIEKQGKQHYNFFKFPAHLFFKSLDFLIH